MFLLKTGLYKRLCCEDIVPIQLKNVHTSYYDFDIGTMKLSMKFETMRKFEFWKPNLFQSETLTDLLYFIPCYPRASVSFVVSIWRLFGLCLLSNRISYQAFSNSFIGIVLV